MFPGSRFFTFSAAIAVCAASGFAQDVISAKSGLVHYIEGDVNVSGTPVADKNGTFTDIKKDGDLTTALGRAEVLLTPGVFLRVSEQSSVKMLNTALADTRVELVSGNAMIESDTPMKDNLVTVFYKDYATTFPKHGLYEFQSNPPQLKVYSGEAVVTAGGQSVTVREGRLLSFTAALAQERFDPKQGDSLYRWSKMRSEYISVANVSAARSAQSTGYGSGFLSGLSRSGFGNWFYNPSYGMYTYLPYAGTYYSPFGFSFFSPYTVYQAYQPSGNGSGIGTNRLSHSALLATSSNVGSPALNVGNSGSVSSGSARTGGSIGGGAAGGSHASGHGR